MNTKPQILVIDDEQQILRALRTILAQQIVRAYPESIRSVVRYVS